MSCSEWILELVECARRRDADGCEPDPALRRHLAGCTDCRERWNAECELSAHLRVMRIHASAPRPSMQANREALMKEFALRTAGMRMNAMGSRPAWLWAASAAAALLFAAGVGGVLGRVRHNEPRRIEVRPVSPAHTPEIRNGRQSFVYEVSADAGSLSTDEFIAVPYTPPLATGEIVRVVRTDLYPEALARMGIDVNPAWSGNLPADLVMGQDGFPRAVRLAESAQY
jgi:hypothetical protein